MKFFVLVALSCFFVLVLTSGNSFARNDGSVKGKTLYKNKCQFCHGIKGDGKGPWEKIKISLQYVIYNKFNGAQSNYDGSGRNASDNNTLYACLLYTSDAADE